MTELTGVDYLTGIEYPISELKHISSLEPDIDAKTADYVARFTYLYGVHNMKVPPLFVSEDSYERILRARERGIEPEIRES